MVLTKSNLLSNIISWHRNQEWLHSVAGTEVALGYCYETALGLLDPDLTQDLCCSGQSYCSGFLSVVVASTLRPFFAFPAPGLSTREGIKHR